MDAYATFEGPPDIENMERVFSTPVSSHFSLLSTCVGKNLAKIVSILNSPPYHPASGRLVHEAMINVLLAHKKDDPLRELQLHDGIAEQVSPKSLARELMIRAECGRRRGRMRI